MLSNHFAQSYVLFSLRQQRAVGAILGLFFEYMTYFIRTFLGNLKLLPRFLYLEPLSQHQGRD